MKSAAILLAVCPTFAGCVPVPESHEPIVRTATVNEGSVVGLGESVSLGAGLVVSPVAVVEDSRCPIAARCVWAGRLVVRTQIDGQADGEAWRDTADMRLGETFGTHGRVIALVSGEPAKTAERETPPETYRFVYKAR